MLIESVLHKAVGEVIFPSFDLRSYLRFGDSVATLKSSVVVTSGDDENPSLMLYLYPYFVGSLVVQPIMYGNPGVVYEVTVHVSTTLNDVFDITWIVAITDGADTGVLAKSYTTLLYPVLIEDSVDSVIEFNKASLYTTGLQDSISIHDPSFSVTITRTVDYKSYSMGLESIQSGYTGGSTIAGFGVTLTKTVDYKSYSLGVESITPDNAWLNSVTLTKVVDYRTTTMSVESITVPRLSNLTITLE